MAAKLVEQQYEIVDVDVLTQHPANPRRGDVDKLAESVEVNGFYGALVVQRSTGHVLAGNHRLQAARREGIRAVPVVYVDVDDERARKILLVDNRANDLAGYDESALAALLGTLPSLAGTGYTDDDLAALLVSHGSGEDDEDDDDEDELDLDEQVGAVAAITTPGTLWQLGPHRVLCGDCRSVDDVARLLDGRQIDVAFTSPPYASQRKYDESSPFRPILPDDYVDWFEAVQARVRENLAETGSWFVNIKEHADGGQRHLYVKDLTIAHVRRWGWLFVDELCWVDARNGIPGGWPNRFKDAWEPVFHYSRGGRITFNPLANGTQSADVFDYSASNAVSRNGSGLLGTEKPGGFHEGLARPSNVVTVASASTSGHPAAFPADLARWFIRAYSDEGGLIFDPFLGSGTTLVAAHAEDRVSYGMEISAGYVDVACARYQKLTGELPVNLATGEAVDFLKET